MAREFEELALDGHNFPTWALDIKISLAAKGIVAALTPPDDRAQPLSDQFKYAALFIIRHHIHADLKSEYALEEEPSTLFAALKTRYEQKIAIILPEAQHEWNHIRLQDFKSIGDYNHAVHKICAKLRFCNKEPDDEEKIEKTISSMLPSDRILQQQYRKNAYTTYPALIHDLLQAEKHDELSMKIHRQRPVGSAPLPEVNYAQGKTSTGPKDQNKNDQGGKRKRKRNKKGKKKVQGKEKGNSKAQNDTKCRKCGMYKHSTRKCRTPKHLVDLYMKSQGQGKTAASGYEAHFTANTDATAEAGCSRQVPEEPSNGVAPMTTDDCEDPENTLVEFASDDMFGDLE